MLKSEEQFDPNSCWNKASWDEPIFILRCKDPVTPRLLRIWANLRVAYGYNKCSDDKIESALTLANKIEEWRRANPNKIKELPKASPTHDQSGSSNDNSGTIAQG